MATPTVQELTEQLKTLTGEKETLTTQLKDANQKVSDLQGQLTTQTTKVTELQGQLTTAQGQVTELQGKLTTAEGQVTTLKSEAKTAEQRAIELAAAQGIKMPGSVPKEENATEGKELLTQFNAIKDPVERNEFFREHKQELLKAQDEAERQAKRRK